MATVDLPTLQFTPVEEIPAKVRKVRTTFFQHKTRPIEFRIQQLRKLYWALKDREHLVVEALYRDLGKPKYEAYVSEINIVENDIVFIQKNVAKWAKDEKAQNINMPFTLMKPRIRKDPLGCILVIGLNILPLIGAIAAGNTVVVKPSESSPNCAAVLQEIIEAAIDPDVVSVVQGGATETQALLAECWDKICFTGNATVGRIVAQAAAPNLTPVLLELGGRNPAFITKKADVRLAARRLFWAKTFNAGQVCLSQNYILVDKEIVSQLVTEFGKASPDFCRIINDAAFRRIKGMIDSTKGKILLGGTMDEKERFIEPTLVQVDSADDPLIRRETFGPVITILPVGDLDEAIRISNDVDNTPLAAYAFGTKKEVEKVLSCVRSGGATINDAYMHGVIPNVPFGGVGESGSGAYHGRSSFDAFVHRRSIATTPGWVERMLSVRYPPYAGKLRSTLRHRTVAPNFDRSGRTTTGFWGWIIWFITFGGGANKSGASRAAVAVHISATYFFSSAVFETTAIALNYYIKRGVKV
ncbi:conserved hypothetical protein [Histoplasma mississippiense (nom. inval.)]|uniref:conserved hypothetical protein n=1 Tax=Ajellomyces capsulatus (strain NAm1 / WU24) TaxID=2059318 RepID=UPI000157CD25|nr:conserved hypothetical protein [Histoplasma mississippiense (nom. inval.)]EDN10602.1 conserved hypothetical protein [Histoplasma mississippiense (nom. inval.)]